jgi:hypothetical protein
MCQDADAVVGIMSTNARQKIIPVSVYKVKRFEFINRLLSVSRFSEARFTVIKPPTEAGIWILFQTQYTNTKITDFNPKSKCFFLTMNFKVAGGEFG